MARIPEAELERLKRETDLVALVTAAGVELRRHGANLVGRCPFHEDQGPSLVVTPVKNLWHCLGACQAGGSVIDWVMRSERVSFRHAVELLMKRAPSEIPSPPRARTTTQPALAPITDDDDHALARAVIDHYHATLKESPEAIAYLESRGLNSVALIDHFQLGFANRTLGYRLPKKILKAGSEVRGRLQHLGFLRASGHEHLTGSITVPVFGQRGQVVQCYGRKITPNLRDGTPLHLYLPSPHTAVWNVDALVSSKEIILCEALIDAMTFWTAGFQHVIASYGVSGFVDAHRAALRRYGTERVLIAYDGDEAGERAAMKVADELQHMGIAAYRVHFPHGLDVNAYANAHVPARESLGALLQAATWIGKPAPTVTPATVNDSSLAASLPSDEPPPRPMNDAHPALALERRGDEIVGTAGDRTYRVRGLAKNQTTDVLRVNLCACRQTQMHVDTLDLYAARARTIFIAQAAVELGVNEETVKREVGALLLALEAMVAEQLHTVPVPAVSTTPAMSDTDRDAALALLRDPNLLGRITRDIAAAGIVGEETNALVAYLAAVSRKLPEPLAVIIQSASAAGKTSLMDAVLSFVPPEDRVQYSAMTGQALFYMAETDLKHKVLAVVEEEGAERAAYALKLLQSEGELSIASTGKDPTTGKLVTHAYRVEGPVMIMLTTTAVELDEEFVNRALVLTVDETPAQTRAIHVRQRTRRTLAGRLQNAAKRDVLALHRNAQRLLEAVTVVNPYAPSLTFQDARTRTRRDHEKYLTLIDVVAFLHQHQRNQRAVMQENCKLSYVEVTPADIAIADRLARAVLTRSLDELPPQTRRFLTQLSAWLATEHGTTRFLAREARLATGLGATQVKLHLRRLIDLEYVVVHRTRDAQGIAYELVYDGAEESSLDILCQTTTEMNERSAEMRERSGVGRPPVGPRSGGGRSRPPSRIALHDHELADVAPRNPPTNATTHSNGRSHDKSYVPQSLEEVRV